MLDGVQANHLTVKSLTFCRVRTKNLHECYWIFFFLLVRKQHKFMRSREAENKTKTARDF